jgi:hypothetical protein
MTFCTKCGAPVEGAFCTKCGTQASPPGAPSPGIPQPPPAAAQAPVPPAAAPVPKKRSPLLWILCGCLGLIVIGIIVMVAGGIFVARKAGLDTGLMKRHPELAAAKMLVSMNPDVELVNLDEDHGIIKVKDKKTGKILTVNLAEAKNGKLVFQDDQNKTMEIETHGEGDKSSVEIRSSEGTMRMGASAAAQLPGWLPAYPGAESTGTYSLNEASGMKGTCGFKSSDSPEKVASFYESALKNAGFQVQKTTTQIPGQGGIFILSGKDEAGQRTAQVTAAAEEQGTSITLVFEAPK